ncbi:MAG TPA: alpha/beta hydrolase [Fimbriimonadaceae bacterium]|nr:alpha/beta hydrolase [Fimbriimonadaceae bacterium]
MLHLAVACALLACSSPASFQAKDGSVSRDDVTLHYTTVGSGAPLIMLSGGPGQDVSQLSELVSGISAARTCVLLEQRGTGRSTLTKLDESTVRADLYVEDLEALRKDLGQAKLHILGHSWGAMLGAAYASRYPDKVGLLVLVDPGPLCYDHLGPATDNIKQRYGLLGVGGAESESQTLKELRPFFYDQAKAEAFARRPKQGRSAPVGGLIMRDLESKKFDFRTGLSRLRCPVLMLQGRQDLMPESFRIDVQRRIPGARLQFIERAGHFPWIEQPGAFFQELTAFLSGQRNPRR